MHNTHTPLDLWMPIAPCNDSIRSCSISCGELDHWADGSPCHSRKCSRCARFEKSRRNTEFYFSDAPFLGTFLKAFSTYDRFHVCTCWPVSRFLGVIRHTRGFSSRLSPFSVMSSSRTTKFCSLVSLHVGLSLFLFSSKFRRPTYNFVPPN